MEVIQIPRGSGKTKFLIEHSAKYNIPIITAHNPKYTLQKAKELGFEIPEPIWIVDLIDDRNKGYYNSLYRNYNNVLIDDVDTVLRLVLNGLSVEYATLTPDTMKFIEKGKYKIMKYEDYLKRESLLPFWSNYIIESYKVVVPNKVIIVNFTDGQSEKVVCDKNDTFDLRRGLFIAIAKHMHKNKYTLEGIEHKATEMSYEKVYVKVVESAIKKHNREEKELEKTMKIVEERKAAELRKKEKKRLKAQKRRNDLVKLIGDGVREGAK